MSVENLTTTDLTSALKQLVSSAGFGDANAHLSLTERAAISNGIWPTAPVFTPYAITHHGYSQMRIDGVKYLTHRVTYQSLRGDLVAGNDVSHILYLGSRTSLNINPLHLVQEDNILNQTRKLCALYMERMLDEWADGVLGPASWSEADFVAWV